MVPRSYTFSSPTPAKPPKNDEKGWAKTSDEHKSGRTSMSTSGGSASKMFTPSPPTPSKPVIIPTRSRNGAGDSRKRSREPMSKNRAQVAEIDGDPSSTPPSVASYRTKTSSSNVKPIPEADARRNSLSLAHHKMKASSYREGPRRSISSSSPQSWGMLQSPPEGVEHEIGSFESDTTLGPLSSVRSWSSESMPSLETDTDSSSSTSNPATPSLLQHSRTNSDKRQKSLSTSVGEDCIANHPLLDSKCQVSSENISFLDEEPSVLPTPSPLARSRTYFKSNLTASFRKIRSAAQSISAFTAPPTQRDDYLARTLLSRESQYTDERRPLPSTRPPDPALRRYLNPTVYSPAELHFHCGKSAATTPTSCKTSIQLQTYQRRSRASAKASSPPVFHAAQQKALDAIDGLPQVSLPRQREPRENCDFLRVIVLEMNMRKKGKLNDSSPGRARLWLPARQGGGAAEVDTVKGDSVEHKRVPARWAGTAV